MDKVKDAPEGATHYNEGNRCYYKITEDGCMIYSKSEDKWTKSNYAWKAIPKQESTSSPEPTDIWDNAPEGAEWFTTDTQIYYRECGGKMQCASRFDSCWRDSAYAIRAAFLKDGNLLHCPPKEENTNV